MKLFELPQDYLLQSMRVRNAQQDMIASNIANVNTPGYKSARVDFKQTLANQIAAVHKQNLSENRQNPPVQPVVTEDLTSSPGNDLNNVNLETEMVRQMKATMHYQAMAKMMQNKFSILDKTIEGASR